MRLCLPVALLCFSSISFAQHGEHRELKKIGKVEFQNSCKPAASAQLTRGVALLHSFEFSRAQAAFRAALKADQGCGIAYWGMALADWTNPFAPGIKAKSQLVSGLEHVRLGKAAATKTERERAYLDAVEKLYADHETVAQPLRMAAYRDAMQQVAASNPGDPEAQIFYALAMAVCEPLGDKTHAERLKAGIILEKLFREQPEHPGLAHYIIHTYDVPALAEKSLAAAKRYSRIAPDAPHALHMPSHTFTRIGYWRESIESNKAAAKAARREQQTAEELHASDYQIYAYLQTMQDKNALKVVKALPEMAARFDPKVVVAGAAPPSAGIYAIAAIPARYALERKDWAQAAELKASETPVPYADAVTWFARGMGGARLKRPEFAQEAAAKLAQLRDRLKNGREDYWAEQVDIQRLEVAAWGAWAEGKHDAGLALMEEAVLREDKTDKSALTPGPLAPARELLGEMLLELGKPKLAFEQFELSLQKEPGRFRSTWGATHAARLANDDKNRYRYLKELSILCEDGDEPGRIELQRAYSR